VTVSRGVGHQPQASVAGIRPSAGGHGWGACTDQFPSQGVSPCLSVATSISSPPVTHGLLVF
jgi:hypothetical protein